jgi:Co/Zn/Cd efflux system component
VRRLGYTVFEVVFAVVNAVFLVAAVLAVAWLVALGVLALSGL